LKNSILYFVPYVNTKAVNSQEGYVKFGDIELELDCQSWGFKE